MDVRKALSSITCRESRAFGLAARGQMPCARPAAAAELMHVCSSCQSLVLLSLPIRKQCFIVNGYYTSSRSLGKGSGCLGSKVSWAQTASPLPGDICRAVQYQRLCLRFPVPRPFPASLSSWMGVPRFLFEALADAAGLLRCTWFAV